MAGPHPVVGLTPELAHRHGRGAHETYIHEGLVHNKIPDIVVVERYYSRGAVGVGFRSGLFEFGALRLESVALKFCELVGHVFHALHELHGKARNGDFLVEALCKETVFQIVLFRCGKALDAAVSAVVVGGEQALLRNHLAGASSAELHDGVLQRSVVDVVDVLGSEAATDVAHGLFVELLEHGQQPHPFVGPGRQGHDKAEYCNKYPFHLIDFKTQI